MNRALILNSFLQNNSLGVLLEAVSTVFGGPVIVTDNAFHIVSAFAAENLSDSEYRRAIQHSELPLSVCKAVTERISSPDADRFFNSDGARFYINELEVDGVTLGYFMIMPDSAKTFSNDDFEFAQGLVSKQFYIERHANGIAADTAEELLIDLLDGRFKDKRVFEIKALGTFLAHFDPSYFALIDMPEGQSGMLDGKGLKDELSHRLRASHPFIYNGEILLFLHDERDVSVLRSLAEDYGLKAVLSDGIDEIYTVKNYYGTVKRTLDYLRQVKSGPFFERSGDYALLMLLSDVSQKTDFMCEEIKKIYEYDSNNGGELCLTLYTYLVCRHSLLETCERLFTHRNTVQYRIRRVREEFGIDTDDADKCIQYLFSLSLALVRLGYNELFIVK